MPRSLTPQPDATPLDAASPTASSPEPEAAYEIDTFEFVDPSSGQPWTARFVLEGESYGRNLCLTHDRAEPMIEFYDRRHIDKFVEANGGHRWGQFVARYYHDTLFDEPVTTGLNLAGDIPTWSLSAAAMRLVSNWLKGT